MRLLIFALISEIPFNLMVGSRIFYPIHQNVLWTFLISIALIHMNEKAKSSNHFFKRLFTGILSVILGFVLGLVTMVDFYHAGVLTVLAFYFFRGRKWWCYLGQLISIMDFELLILSGRFADFSQDFAEKLEKLLQKEYPVRVRSARFGRNSAARGAALRMGEIML